VRYVVNRPYSAGEAHDVVTARVVKTYDEDPGLLDLAYGPKEDATAVTAACRSDRQEPGTWHGEAE
jgi:hypothetical protein